MKKSHHLKSLLAYLLFLLPYCLFAQPGNNAISSAIQLTSGVTCSNTAGTLSNGTAATGTAGINTFCTATTTSGDVWYYFVAQSTFPTVALSGMPTSGSASIDDTPGLQIFNTNSTNSAIISTITAATLNGLSSGCINSTSVTSLSLTPGSALTVGNVYLVRVMSTTTTVSTTASRWSFNICVTDPAPPPANDDYSAAVALTSGVTCSNTAGTLSNGVAATGTAGINTFCTATASSGDVWYYFVAQSTFPTLTLSGMPTSGSASIDDTPGLQIFNTNSTNPTIISTITVATLNGLSSGCINSTGVTSLSLTPGSALTVGNVYLVRVMSTTTTVSTTASRWGFNICVTDPPSNDDCANAASIVSGTTCIAGTSELTGQTLYGTTVEGTGIATSCGGSTTSQDVWYKFTAQNAYPTITVNNLGSGWGIGLRIQLLSGTCGSFTEVACANNAPLIPGGSGLTIGNTYYIRILKNNTTAPTGGAAAWAFDICVTGGSGRMSEVFQQITLSPANVLDNPWEITYGPDNYLWVTESRGYKVYRMDPSTGAKTTVLDISQGSTFFSTPSDQAFNLQFNVVSKAPQGGLAGLALHPKFFDAVSPQNYVYISYIHTYDSVSAFGTGYGTFYTNSIVRFFYNSGTGKLESPLAICDTLPGSNDHNSQRLITAPVGGTDFLFYAAGDMGAGQFTNQYRINHSQNAAFYEGKILRFNLASDGDGGLDQWIPNDNPFNGTKQSAVWAVGIRNNQGLAYDSARNILYGSSHGPYSDDEINIIQRNKNYGHPLVIGYAADNNYNNSSAGAPNTTSSCPLITNEVSAAAAIPNYKDPLFTAYPVAAGNTTTPGTIRYIWTNNPGNGGWPSEAWSGMGIYKNTYVPGWQNSLVLCSLKWGRLIRLKLDTLGTSVLPTDGTDTVTYFGSTNRYRDIAIAPNGKDMYVVMDKSATTSGPSAANPVVPACGGCVIKYTFLGYADASGKSALPDAIDIVDTARTTYTSGIRPNTIIPGTTVVVDNTNKNLWVPITGPDGNILAEIYPNGNVLDTVTSTFYIRSGAIRQDATGRHYLNRSFTITPKVQPTLPGGSPLVKIRLYLTNAEFAALNADPLSGVNALSDLLIRKNNDASSTALTNTSTTNITPSFAGAHGTGGYVLQGNISSFSSFYIGSNNVILPVTLLDFKGSLQNNTAQLQWRTTSETNTSHFIVERSTDGRTYQSIGTVTAKGNSTTTVNYDYIDYDVTRQSASIIYYRLKIMDKDDAYKYSNVITITLPFITGRLNLFPNPAAEEVNVSVAAPVDGKLQWKLMDNTGRVVLHNSTQLKKGNNNFSININKLSTGLYYLIASGAGIDQKVKLQKL